mmetsp:Transcript_15884/g.36252  ORF Transcript_15884/g.36252 Transcript_15884/m.36252 type:complete len:245 (-) Transcript_15884:12033-12767(-)
MALQAVPIPTSISRQFAKPMEHSVLPRLASRFPAASHLLWPMLPTTRPRSFTRRRPCTSAQWATRWMPLERAVTPSRSLAMSTGCSSALTTGCRLPPVPTSASLSTVARLQLCSMPQQLALLRGIHTTRWFPMSLSPAIPPACRTILTLLRHWIFQSAAWRRGNTLRQPLCARSTIVWCTIVADTASVLTPRTRGQTPMTITDVIAILAMSSTSLRAARRDVATSMIAPLVIMFATAPELALIW